jgi:hypothetical protein
VVKFDMTEREFLLYLQDRIPLRHRTDAEADYTYQNIRGIISVRLQDLYNGKN